MFTTTSNVHVSSGKSVKYNGKYTKIRKRKQNGDSKWSNRPSKRNRSLVLKLKYVQVAHQSQPGCSTLRPVTTNAMTNHSVSLFNHLLSPTQPGHPSVARRQWVPAKAGSWTSRPCYEQCVSVSFSRSLSTYRPSTALDIAYPSVFFISQLRHTAELSIITSHGELKIVF